MSHVQRDGEGFVVDVALLAAAFGIDAAEVPGLMKAGLITSRCETGTESDAGTYRLTFWHGTRACRFTVDANGAIVKRASFDAAARGAAR